VQTQKNLFRAKAVLLFIEAESVEKKKSLRVQDKYNKEKENQ
jgi:hypothetical protein